METKVKEAFDKIHATPELKRKTAEYLLEQRGKHSARRRPLLPRFAVALSAIALVVLLGGAFSLYATPVAYIDMDVNPSIELAVNRFGRVTQSATYNNDAIGILQNAKVQNQPYADAVNTLINEMMRQAYLQEDSLVTVTVQSGDTTMEQALLQNVKDTVSTFLTSHQSTAVMEVYSVSREIKEESHDHHMTPAKYLAITDLQIVDASASFETCAGHSISELRRQTQNHSNEHRKQALESHAQ